MFLKYCLGIYVNEGSLLFKRILTVLYLIPKTSLLYIIQLMPRSSLNFKALKLMEKEIMGTYLFELKRYKCLFWRMLMNYEVHFNAFVAHDTGNKFLFS